MTTIRPEINLDTGMLVISIHGAPERRPLRVPLNASPANMASLHSLVSRVCGDEIAAFTYNTPEVVNFFSTAVGAPCTLARFPADSTTTTRRQFRKNKKSSNEPRILLSNESPILIVNMNSVDALNQQIGHTDGKKSSVDVFRANVVLRDTMGRPYAEDAWHRIKIGSEFFEVCTFLSTSCRSSIGHEKVFLTGLYAAAGAMQAVSHGVY